MKKNKTPQQLLSQEIKKSFPEIDNADEYGKFLTTKALLMYRVSYFVDQVMRHGVKVNG